jgi:hypothetical protein
MSNILRIVKNMSDRVPLHHLMFRTKIILFRLESEKLQNYQKNVNQIPV